MIVGCHWCVLNRSFPTVGWIVGESLRKKTTSQLQREEIHTILTAFVEIFDNENGINVKRVYGRLQSASLPRWGQHQLHAGMINCREHIAVVVGLLLLQLIINVSVWDLNCPITVRSFLKSIVNTTTTYYVLIAILSPKSSRKSWFLKVQFKMKKDGHPWSLSCPGLVPDSDNVVIDYSSGSASQKWNRNPKTQL